MSAKRTSGVGFAEMMSFAMLQIFCFAPAMRPPIEPVVSRTKQTSMRCLAGFFTVSVAGDFSCATEQIGSRARMVAVSMCFMVRMR